MVNNMVPGRASVTPSSRTVRHCSSDPGCARPGTRVNIVIVFIKHRVARDVHAYRESSCTCARLLCYFDQGEAYRCE